MPARLGVFHRAVNNPGSSCCSGAPAGSLRTPVHGSRSVVQGCRRSRRLPAKANAIQKAARSVMAATVRRSNAPVAAT